MCQNFLCFWCFGVGFGWLGFPGLWCLMLVMVSACSTLKFAYLGLGFGLNVFGFGFLVWCRLRVVLCLYFIWMFGVYSCFDCWLYLFWIAVCVYWFAYCIGYTLSYCLDGWCICCLCVLVLFGWCLFWWLLAFSLVWFANCGWIVW